MTRIFISHSHADRQIASLLVDFLLAALELKPEEIRCTSVPGHQLPFGTSISEQLKKDLDKATSLIALITKDSLRSTWVLFELGSSWATGKIVVPILGPGISYSDLPGPLKQYPSVQIEDENSYYRIIDAINQLASTLDIREETNVRKQAKLNDFIPQFKAWTSQLPDPDLSQQKQIEELNKELEEIKIASQQEKQKLEQSYQTLIKEKDVEITRLQEQIKQLQSSQKSNVKVTVEIELKSERGVDYTRLRDLLAAGEWKEADMETGKVMLQAAGRESEGYVDADSINNFPCEDLRTINQLWLHYSDGKFGFSVQKDIYQNLGGKKEYNEQVWINFCERIGWRKGGNWLSYSDLTFNLELAPRAHLPTVLTVLVVGRYGRLWGREKKISFLLFSRAKTCNL